MTVVLKRLLAPFAIAIAALILDQLIKLLVVQVAMDPSQVIPVTSFFNLVLVFNPGVSFGMLADYISAAPQFFAGVKLLVVIGLMFWAARISNTYDRLALGSIAGGALGNIVDRYVNGAVTDYLDFYVSDWHWPAFNLADIFIVAGAAVLIASSMLGKCETPTSIRRRRA